jgi:hypothetical protein
MPAGRKQRTDTKGPSERVSLIAYVAARLAGVPNRAMDEFLGEDLKVRASASSVERTVAPMRAASPYKRRTGPKRSTAANKSVAPAFWDWLLVDESRLGVRKALVRILGFGRRQDGLIDWLRELPGVRQIIETSFDRELIIVVLFRDSGEGERIRAQIEEHAPDRGLTWQEILREEHLPAVQTWRHLASQAAAELDTDRQEA